jgi:hypothetical protein
MAYLQTALVSLLTNVTAIKNLIASRLYYETAPEVVTYPYVVFQYVSDPDEKKNIGKDGSSPTIQFKIIATSAITAEDIDIAFRTVLNEYSGTQQGILFYHIKSRGRVPGPITGNGYYEINHDYKMEYER